MQRDDFRIVAPKARILFRGKADDLFEPPIEIMGVFESAVARNRMQQLAAAKQFFLRAVDAVGGQVTDRAFSRRPFEQTGKLTNAEIRLPRQLLHGQLFGVMLVHILNRTLDCSRRVLFFYRSRLLEQGAQQLLESDLPFELLQLIFARPAPQQSLTIDEYAMSRLHPENAIEREAKRFLLLISFAGIGGDCPK